MGKTTNQNCLIHFLAQYSPTGSNRKLGGAWERGYSPTLVATHAKLKPLGEICRDYPTHLLGLSSFLLSAAYSSESRLSTGTATLPGSAQYHDVSAKLSCIVSISRWRYSALLCSMPAKFKDSFFFFLSPCARNKNSCFTTKLKQTITLEFHTLRCICNHIYIHIVVITQQIKNIWFSIDGTWLHFWSWVSIGVCVKCSCVQNTG